MVRPDLKATELYCPHQSCGKRMVRDECGIFCQGCGYEAATWAAPVDADVPMDVLVARERRVARRRAAVLVLGATAGLAALAIGVRAIWLSTQSAPIERRTNELTMDELRRSFAAGKLPAGMDLPRSYREPDLFLLPQHRVAQTDLVIYWQTRSEQEKVELLELVKQSESFELLPFVAEIAWFTSSSETSEAVSRSMLDALYLGSRQFLELVEFLASHMASTTPHAEVRSDATQFVAILAERRSRFGR